jgi:hypothetical protein
MNTVTLEKTYASMSYLFSLYEASFALTKTGTYSSIIKLNQKGGLVATYYRTVDFQSPVQTLDLYDHNGGKYTRVDPTIDFDIGYDPMISSGYPTQYYSVEWKGSIRAPLTEIYRLSLKTFNNTFIQMYVNGKLVIDNNFMGLGTKELYTDQSLVKNEFTEIIIRYA